MKQIVKYALICACLSPTFGQAQEPEVDRNLYSDYSPERYPDYSLLIPLNLGTSLSATEVEEALPDYVNNAETAAFPPVFNQAGGSCSAASRIGYMFTHEMNAYRGTNGKLMVNRYPSHFVWLMTNGNSGKYAIVQHVGVPNAAVYGGTTYSHLFGNQTAFENNFGWMQGYDKWYSAMFNRMKQPAHFPLSLKTEEGRIALKHWLYNHNGDTSYKCGGVAGVGVGINGKWAAIPQTPTNDEIGVTGKKFVQSWGVKFNHALTIVGYDDRIEFDLDGNGIKGEKDKDEVGAWIIVNSWGSGFGNKGFIYCPYAHAGKTFKKGPDGLYFGGHWWFPEIFKVQKDYRPLRTIKVEMDYSRRSEICLSVGIATDLNATVPERTIPLHHFQYAGDGKHGKTMPAPQVPMLGKWADGKLHYEPMEFGYDLTGLSSFFDKNMPLKYFFIVETRDWAQGEGKIHHASIIDYEFDREGSEVPFLIDSNGVTIQNKGKQTIISTVVSGESYYEPQNFTISQHNLSWQTPLASIHKISGYQLYADNVLLNTLPADTYNYQLPENSNAITYSLSALYENSTESSRVTVSAPVEEPQTNQCLRLSHSGFTIPNIFDSKYDEATIEFWIRPRSLVDYNQGAGPGWNEGFKFHSNANGNFVVGWDQENRTTTPNGTLKVGQWTHLAIVVKHNIMTIYVNGQSAATITTNAYTGIGGYEKFDFGSTEDDNNIDADIDEFRVWNYARTSNEISQNKNVEYVGNLMPNGLLAYYKGTTATLENRTYLRDFAGVNHARLLSQTATEVTADGLITEAPSDELHVKIRPLTVPVYCGLPVRFEATHSDVATDIWWNAKEAGINELHTATPSFTFKKAGKYSINVTVTNTKQEKITDTYEVNVVAPPAPSASFYINQEKISAGEHVTFIAEQPRVGYLYEWNMPGALTDKSFSINAATTYPENGKYKVSLTVTAPDGNKVTSAKEIEVVEVAPKADFDISPSVILKGEIVHLSDLSKYKPTQWQWLLHSEGRDLIVKEKEGDFIATTPGVYDITLQVSNNQGQDQITRQRGLTICNADSKNGLFFTSKDALIQLASNPLSTSQSSTTIDWWMNPGDVTANSNGIGKPGAFMLTTNENASMTLNLGGLQYSSAIDFVKANEWHHYAVTFNAGQLNFYRDGRLNSSKKISTTTIPACPTIIVGGEQAPFHGEIDELRIWTSALDETTIRQYANQPIEDIERAQADHHLSVYYDFNQGGGNVIDRTGNGYDGTRQNFGPDGDAWALSQGVFCLNLKDEGLQDITAQYLKNYKSPFRTDGSKLVNATVPSRFYAIADWNLENMTVNGNITTTVHVDKQKSDCFTMTSGWDGFGDLKNHKAFQTMTLPAGAYTFIADYAEKNNAGKCGDSYLVANIGKSLPNTDQLSSALSFKKMQPKSKVCMSNNVKFILEKETEISLGLLINMTGDICSAITQFHLIRNEVEFIKFTVNNGYDLTISQSGLATLCLPYSSSVPNGATAYVVNEIKDGKAWIASIDNNVIPAEVGVIIKAEPGTYHFTPTTTKEQVNSILTGILEDTPLSANLRYYQLEGEGFVRFEGTTLEANHAYLVRNANDTVSIYPLEQVQSGIIGIDMDNTSMKIYDISGREIKQPKKGIYITNNKKIYVK